MKNQLSKIFIALAITTAFISCKKDKKTEPSKEASGSIIKATIGGVNYDSEVNGKATTTKVTIPFAGDQIAIASALSDTKTLNLTFLGVTGTGTFTSEAVLFYSPDGTSANSIGNDDACSDVNCKLIVTKYEANLIEGTFTAVLKKSDCSGATTTVTGGSFIAKF